MFKIKYYLSVVLLISCLTPNIYANAPGNDLSGGADPLTMGVWKEGTNIGAESDRQNTCGYNKASVWYSFTVSSVGNYTIETKDVTFNDVLTVFNNSFGEEGCTNEDEYGFYGERLVLNLSPGNHYVMVSGADCTFGRTIGDFSIKVRATIPADNPAAQTNEICDAAVVIYNATTALPPVIRGSTRHASEAERKPSCSLYRGPSVWYKIENYNTNITNVDFMQLKLSVGLNFSEIIAIYKGTGCSDLTEIACNRNGDDPHELVIVLENDEDYYIQIMGNFSTIEADFRGPVVSAPDYYVELSTLNCPMAMTACDDGDPNTTGDEWNADCECRGTCVLEGNICDDGDPDTVGDVFDEYCNCVESCGNEGDPCNDSNPNTLCDVFDQNCNCQGICQIMDINDCPLGTVSYDATTCECIIPSCTIGTSCDITPTTAGFYDANCNCIEVGDPCYDNNPYTIDITYDGAGAEIIMGTMDQWGNCVGSCNVVCYYAAGTENEGMVNEDYVINEFCECECFKTGMFCEDADAGITEGVFNEDCVCEELVEAECVEIVTVTAANVSTPYFEASNLIQTAPDEVVTVTGNLDLNAGERIKLNPGFSVKGGATFHGYIEGCGQEGLSEVGSVAGLPPKVHSGPLGTVINPLPAPPAGTESSLDWVRHYPNPFKDEITIAFKLSADAAVSIIVSDINGRQLTEVSRESYEGTQEINLSTASWIPGIYAYQLVITENTTGVSQYASGKLVKL